MIKYDDTEVISVLDLASGSYALIYSEQCAEETGTGYSVRGYADLHDVNPFVDQYSDGPIDFVDLEQALADMEDDDYGADTPQVRAWLIEELG